MARVEIDLNIRVRGNWTLADIGDADEPVVPGQAVEVFEPESGVVGVGRIEEVDPERRLLFLSVDWASLRESVITPDELKNFVAGVAAAAHQLVLATPTISLQCAEVDMAVSGAPPLLDLDPGKTYGSEVSDLRAGGSVLSRT